MCLLSYNVCLSVCMSQFKGYNVNKIAACTLLLEGTIAVNNCVRKLSTVNVIIVGGVYTEATFI